MNIAPTAQNRALAAAVNSQIKAEANNLSARAWFWRLLGLGTMLALTGVGIGIAFFGYSYTLDARSSAEKIAEAMSRALDRTTLKAAGEVRLNAGDTSVKLDAANVTLQADPLKLDPQAMVRLDPAAKVAVATVPDVPRPTAQQLRLDDKSASVVTNYTVFKNALYGSGQVVTGWTFNSSEQTRPTTQYCYYSTSEATGVKTTVDLAENGLPLPTGAGAPGLDRAEALRRCVWYDAPPGASSPHAD